MKMRRCVLWGVCLLAGLAGAATWTGAGDGTSWNDSLNWQDGAVPTGTDAATFSLGSAALTVTVGGTGGTCTTLNLTSAGKITFTGTGTLGIQNLTADASVEFACPVELRSGGNTLTALLNRTVDFTGAVTAVGTKNVIFSSNSKNPARINFRSTFTGSGASLQMQFGTTGNPDMATVHFYGKVIAKELHCGKGGYKNGRCYLHATGNEIETVRVCYGRLVFQAENALPATTYLSWNDYYCENAPDHYSFDFAGYDQIAEAVRHTTVNTSGRDECRYLISSSGDMMLTLKGTSDASANCYVYPGVSITWDPTGDYVQTFSAKASTTAGGIVVKRGTVRVSDTATFSSLTSVKIESGATFDLASTKANALAALVDLTIGANATMKIASTAAQAFSDNRCTATIAAGGVIEAGTAVAINVVYYDGAPVEGGTYTAANAAWVTGAGTVTVIGGAEVSETRRTWTGAGDGATWTDDANWDTRAPFSRDTAVFNTSATITSGFSTGSARTVEVASGATVSVAGTVEGTGALTKTGPGTFTLTGSNTFTGSLTIQSGQLRAIGACALGDNAYGTVEVEKNGNTQQDNLYLDGVTVRKDLVIHNRNDAGNGYARALRVASQTVLLGAFSVPNSYLRMYCEANSKFIIAGGATYNNSSFFDRAAGAEVIVTNSPMVLNIYDDRSYSNGKMVFACAGNSIRQYNDDPYRGMGETIETRVNGALKSNAWFYMGKSHAKLDLCGTTQSISRIMALVKSSTDRTPDASGTVTSVDPAKITYNSELVYTNSAIHAGAVTFEQAGAGTVFFTAVNTTTGSFLSSAGTSVFGAGSKLPKKVELAGGTVRALSPSVMDEETVVAFAGGTLDLAAGNYILGGATDANGDPVAPGSYASAAGDGVQALAGLSGPGVVTILPSGGTPAVYTWTGAGDGRFSQAANWEGNVRPDFSNACGEYRFPLGGYTATMDVDVVAKTLVFPSSAADNVTLAGLTGTETLTLLDGSVVVTSAVANVAKNVSVTVPVKVARSLKVRVGDPANNASSTQTLTFSGRLGTLGSANVVKDGFGALAFRNDDNDITGDVVVSNGLFYAYGANPLGGSGTFYMEVANSDQKTKMVLGGATITRPCSFRHPADNNGSMINPLSCTTNEFTALVSNPNSHFRVGDAAASNAVVRFAAGVSLGQFFIPSARGDGVSYVEIANKAISCGSWYWSDSEGLSRTVFSCPSNHFGTGWNVYNTLELRVDDAIRSDDVVTFNSWAQNTTSRYGLLDVNGTKQTLASIVRSVTTNESGVVTKVVNGRVTGTAGSKLTLGGSATVNVLPVFLDAVSFTQAGTATRSLRNACSSTGTLEVVSGRLVLAAPGAAYNGVAQNATIFEGGSWAGETIQVKGGVLELDHAGACAKESAFAFSNGGKVEIPGGVRIKCAALTVDGVEKRSGTYTATSAGAFVTGGGALVCGEQATVFIFR